MFVCQICSRLDVDNDDAGSTGVVLVFDGATNTLTVGNVGDSMCVLSKRGKAVAVHRMHRVDDRSERDRVIKSGGAILNNRCSLGCCLC